MVGGGCLGMLGAEGRLKFGRGDVGYKRTWRPLGERDGVQRGVTVCRGDPIMVNYQDTAKFTGRDTILAWAAYGL